MKIKAKVCMTEQQEVIACSCSKTGINSGLVVPQLPKVNGKALVLDYVHPLAYWSNAQGLIKSGRAYLNLLEPQVLAGLMITAYEHWSLLDRYTLTAQEANAVLCTASKNNLVDICSLAAMMDAKNTVGTPALVLEWQDIKGRENMDQVLVDYIKTLRREFISPIGEEGQQKKEDRITILNSKALEGRSFKNGVQLLSQKQTMADHEKEFESLFKGNKKEIKSLIESLKAKGLIKDKFLAFLTIIAKDRNLVSMDKEVRTKVCNKLRTLGDTEAERAAKLIEGCENPYDIFAKADDSLDRASDAFNKASKPKSLKEILEAKKRQAMLAEGKELRSLEDRRQEERRQLVDHQEADDVDELMSLRIVEDQDSDLEQEDTLYSDDLDSADEEMVDTYTKMTSGIYASKDF